MIIALIPGNRGDFREFLENVCSADCTTQQRTAISQKGCSADCTQQEEILFKFPTQQVKI